MLDWNFPQRIRYLERDYRTGHTKIINKPYVGQKPYINVWDQFKASIGFAFGDIGFYGEHNVFVEGICDQILLANISKKLEQQGKNFLDLNTISIVPFGNEEALKRNVEIALKQKTQFLVICDRDEAGQKIKKFIDGVGRKCLLISDYIDTSQEQQSYSIEDLIGADTYLKAVNSFYSEFDWFIHDLTEDMLKDLTIGIKKNDSMGKRLEDYFKLVFAKDFSKIAVSIYLIQNLDTIDFRSIDDFHKLFIDINLNLKQ